MELTGDNVVDQNTVIAIVTLPPEGRRDPVLMGKLYQTVPNPT